MVRVDLQSSVTHAFVLSLFCFCGKGVGLFQFRLESTLHNPPDFGHGEGIYHSEKVQSVLTSEGVSSHKLMDYVDELRQIALRSFQIWEELSKACEGNDRAGFVAVMISPAKCRGASQVSFEDLSVLRMSVAEKLGQIHGLDHCRSDQAVLKKTSLQPETGHVVLGVRSWCAILLRHWEAALQYLNVTPEVRSTGLHIAAWGSLAENLAWRVEMMRWHLSYHMLYRIFDATWQDGCLPKMEFHEFCCTSAEVLYQIAYSREILKNARMQKPSNAANQSHAFDAGFVEVGVETGETSRQLLDLLPGHVRLIGVDSFPYSAEEAVRNTASCNISAIRCSKEFSSSNAKQVGELYEKAKPIGRAKLIKVDSPAGAVDPFF